MALIQVACLGCSLISSADPCRIRREGIIKTATDKVDWVAPCMSDLALLIRTGVNPMKVPAIEVILDLVRSLQRVKALWTVIEALPGARNRVLIDEVRFLPAQARHPESVRKVQLGEEGNEETAKA